MAGRFSPNIEAALAAHDKADSTAAAALRLEFPQASAATVVVNGDTAGSHVAPKHASDHPLLFLARSAASVTDDGSGGAQKYLAVSLDLDAPFPSAAFLSPILHGVQTDLVLSEAAPPAPAAAGADSKGHERTGWLHLKSDTPPVIAFGKPNPPPPSAPHRYVFVVWKQPAGLDAAGVRAKMGWPEQVGRLARMRFNVNTLEKELGLGEIVALNFFRSQQS